MFKYVSFCLETHFIIDLNIKEKKLYFAATN